MWSWEDECTAFSYSTILTENLIVNKHNRNFSTQNSSWSPETALKTPGLIRVTAREVVGCMCAPLMSKMGFV